MRAFDGQGREKQSLPIVHGSFRAYRGAALNAATGAVIPFDNEDFDVASWFDVTTGRFTPQVAGYYALTAVLTAGASMAAEAIWQAELRKNGAMEAIGVSPTQGAGGGLRMSSLAQAVVAANGTTDYFDVVVFHTAGAAVAVSTSRSETFFCGHLIGAS